MQINSTNNISFQKKLVAHCSVLHKGKPEHCKIFELDKIVDWDYFKNLLTNRDWRGQAFVEMIDESFNYGRLSNQKYYAIETQKGKKIDFSQIDEFYPDMDELVIIETMPCATHENPDRKRKYIGETMLAFLVEKARLNGKTGFRVQTPIPDAYDFYTKKCGFARHAENGLVMEEVEYDTFIKMNGKHTGQKVEIIK